MSISKKVRFCIQPGYIRSKSDGGRHYITFVQLRQLYHVHRDETVHYHLEQHSRRCEHLIHLLPRYEGDYFDVNEKYPLLSSVPEQTEEGNSNV